MKCSWLNQSGIGDNMKMFLKVWKIVLKSAFLPTSIMLLLVVLSGALSGGLTYGWNLLFQEVYNFTMNNALLDNILFYGTIIASIYLANYISKILLSFMRPNFVEKIKISVVSNIHQKISKIPMEEYENSSTYNDIHMVNNFVSSPHFMIFFFGSLTIINTIVSLLSIIIALSLFSPWLILIALLSIIPIFILRLVRGKKYFQMQVYQAPKLRFQGYLWSLFIDVFSLREIRCYGFENYLEEKWTTIKTEVSEEELRFTKKSSLYQLGADLFKALGLASALILITMLLFRNQLTIGQFGISIITFRTVQSSFHSILNQLSQIATKTPYMSKLVMFIENVKIFEDKEKPKFNSLTKDIVLDNVSFKYPGNDRVILNDINLCLKRGELVAIVGENGAGKTTLVKILMGLFKPTSGVVKYDGIDLNTYQLGSITYDTSAVFQNYTRYALSIRENIAISDLDNLHDDQKIYDLIKYVELDDLLTRSDNNLDQLLKKDFGGLELSGGQWQKIAIARGIFKESNLIVFDEPTSTIDPLLEYKIFALFKELTKERTSILVSHRIGPTKMADKIIVLDDGKIVETGTFNELMALKGKYHELYTLQAQWYQFDEDN